MAEILSLWTMAIVLVLAPTIEYPDGSPLQDGRRGDVIAWCSVCWNCDRWRCNNATRQHHIALLDHPRKTLGRRKGGGSPGCVRE